jgi:hypothetical protein
MVTFPMPANEQDFVLNITRTLKIQAEDLVCKSLPLGFLAGGVELSISGVGLVDEAEIGRYLPRAEAMSVKYCSVFRNWFNEIVVTNKIKCSGVGSVEILEEVSWNTAVRDILRDRFLFQLLGVCAEEEEENRAEQNCESFGHHLELLEELRGLRSLADLF